MRKMRNKRILSIIAVLEMITASVLVCSANAAEDLGGGQVVENPQEPCGNEVLDTIFMEAVFTTLTDIIDDGENWRGKQFGTPGEVNASIQLKTLWDDEIAAGNSHIDNAVRDKVEEAPFKPGIDDYIGTENKDDFSLTLYGLEDNPITIEYPECSPVHTKILQGHKIHNFENAQVNLVPDEWYDLFNEEEDLPEEIIPDTGYDYNVYLIDNNRFEEHTASFALFVDICLLPLSCIPNDIYPTADAFILADVNEDAHLDTAFQNLIPGMMVNGATGDAIIEKIAGRNPETITADFYVKTTYFKDVESYNVVGTINGEVEDIIIIASHYDTVWGPCAADDAGSNSVVWSIAKYIADNEIVPHYTMKFIAWAGEEYGFKGSRSYVNKYNHQENWQYVITLGALGYENRSDVLRSDTKLNVWKLFSKGCQPDNFIDLLESYDYPAMSGGFGGIQINGEKPTDKYQVFMTDGGMFALDTNGLITIDKGTPLIADHWHHRDGQGHTKGNSVDIINFTDLQASGEVVLGILLNLDGHINEGTSSSSQGSQQSSAQSSSSQSSSSSTSSSMPSGSSSSSSPMSGMSSSPFNR